MGLGLCQTCLGTGSPLLPLCWCGPGDTGGRWEGGGCCAVSGGVLGCFPSWFAAGWVVGDVGALLVWGAANRGHLGVPCTAGSWEWMSGEGGAGEAFWKWDPSSGVPPILGTCGEHPHPFPTPNRLWGSRGPSLHGAVMGAHAGAQLSPVNLYNP